MKGQSITHFRHKDIKFFFGNKKLFMYNAFIQLNLGIVELFSLKIPSKIKNKSMNNCDKNGVGGGVLY